MSLFLNVATINCRGLGEKAKRTAFFDHIKKMNFQIFCLQETNSKPSNELEWVREWSTDQAIFNSNISNKRSDSGTAILLNHPLIKVKRKMKENEGRVIAAELKVDTFHFQIINVYGYTSTYPKKQRENFSKIFIITQIQIYKSS